MAVPFLVHAPKIVTPYAKRIISTRMSPNTTTGSLTPMRPQQTPHLVHLGTIRIDFRVPHTTIWRLRTRRRTHARAERRLLYHSSGLLTALRLLPIPLIHNPLRVNPKSHSKSAAHPQCESNDVPAVSGTYLPPAHATDHPPSLVLTAEDAHEHPRRLFAA
jgi:hypothetical protein